MVLARYGSPLAVNNSVSCPVAIGASQCEAFAVLTSPDCQWHAATATAATQVQHAAAGNALVLKIDNATAVPSGATAVGSRAYFANWPVVTVTNAAGTPLLPWAQAVATSASVGPEAAGAMAVACPAAWPPLA